MAKQRLRLKSRAGLLSALEGRRTFVLSSSNPPICMGRFLSLTPSDRVLYVRGRSAVPLIDDECVGIEICLSGRKDRLLRTPGAAVVVYDNSWGHHALRSGVLRVGPNNGDVELMLDVREKIPDKARIFLLLVGKRTR